MLTTIIPARLVRAALLSCATLALLADQATATPVLRIGVRAHSGPEAALEKWGPTAAHLEAAVPGVRFELVPLVHFRDMDAATAAGELDFVLTNSVAFVQLEQKYGLSPLATLRNTRMDGGRVAFSSVIFTRADRDDIAQLEDLRGRSLMGVHVNAFGGWLMARSWLVDQGIDPFEDCSRVLFSSDAKQEDVVRQVLAGKVDVGTVRTGIIEAMVERGEVDAGALRILEPLTDGFPLPHTTALYPEWPFAASAGTAPDLADQVQATLLNMDVGAEASRLGDYTGWVLPLDYGPLHGLLRKFRLPPYDGPGTDLLAEVWIQHRTTVLVTVVAMVLLLVLLMHAARLNRSLIASQEALLHHRADLEQAIERRTASLAASERRYHDLAELAPVGIFHTDPDGHCTYVNDHWSHLTGLESAQALGAGWAAALHPDDGERIAQAWSGAVETGGPFLLEYRFRTPTGRINWVLGHAAPVRDEQEEVVGYIGTVTDITGRRAAEEQLRRLAEAIAQISDSVVVTDAEGKVLYHNPAYGQLSGLGPAELDGQVFRLLQKSGSDPLTQREIWETLTQGRTWNGRLLHRRGEDEARIIDSTLSPVRSKAGRLTSIVAVCKDVTREERLEKQLRQAQKMEAVGQLAGGIAHDFNNIIQAILGNLDFAREGLEPGSERLEDIDRIGEAAERAATLTRQLLAFSRQQVIEPMATDLNDLVERMAPLLRTMLSEDVELEYRLGSGLPAIMADVSQVERILMNLCVNAKDAMPRGGRLSVTTADMIVDAAFCEQHPWAVLGRYLVLEVADTGEGMDESTRLQVFEPFFTTKDVGKGTGLGLATVYGIVKQHGGLIQIESEADEGTMIRVFLPLASTVAEAGGGREAGIIDGGNETILLAEDDPGVLEATSRILEREGYRVIRARDGREALDIFARRGEIIDLCLLDLVMPRMSGREVADAVRTASPETHILFLSGYDPDEVADGPHPAGPVLLKPIPTTELLAQLRRCFDAEPA